MTKLTHSRHKTDAFRYLYRDEDRSLQKTPPGYGSSEDWEVIQEIQSYEQIPEKYRQGVEARGVRIYWHLVAPTGIAKEIPMTAEQGAKPQQLANDAHEPSTNGEGVTDYGYAAEKV